MGPGVYVDPLEDRIDRVGVSQDPETTAGMAFGVSRDLKLKNAMLLGSRETLKRPLRR